ncbi:Ig domain-containing protein [Acidovorax sp. Leaf78]|uniref:Ig domain-containing protein n=1 Tax=unclassified Acidovorax TaxID=2684926 RepID=UPI0009E71C69|nr:Ig domain-containing protein [Acidovorax sp. Leaf78]
MLKFYKLSTILLASFAASCGGGGGSPGTTTEPYSISLRADKVQLPLNIAGARPGIGVSSPYTTTLYVEARKGSVAIPGGTAEVFGCNISGGLSSGSLYYLDGKAEHETDVTVGGVTTKVPNAYRSISLASNSGGNSFHFHSGNQAGPVQITCSITDPSANRVVSTAVDIVVGAATGKASSIKGVAEFPVLGVQSNTANLRTSTAINGYVLDDANQPVPVSSKANLQVAIISGGASNGARLLSGSQSGSVLQVSTIGGVGLFSLASGTSVGTILLEMTTDRADNDVTNGIQDPIVQLYPVAVDSGVVAGTPAPALTLVAATPPAGTNGLPYSYAFSATGGVAPYTWTALGGIPEGLTLSANGILSGTPAVKQVGTFQIAVRLTDSQGSSITGNFPLVIAANAAVDPANNVLSITNSGCGSDLCILPVSNPAAVAPVNGIHYQYALTVTGPGTGGAVWTATGLPTWLSLSADGILTITYTATQTVPKLEDCKSAAFTINANRGGQTATRRVLMSFGTGAGTCRA